MNSINKTQISIGFTALSVGFVFYLVNRPSDIYLASFIRFVDTSYYWNPPFLRTIGGFLPSFLHVFSFSLLLGGLLKCKRTGYLVICCTWFLTNVFFELGQKHAVMASQFIPEWFDGLFILENMRNYFLNGRFDYLDLLASFAGAVAAFLILFRTTQTTRK